LQLQAGVAEKLVHTGQHYDANMSDVFFSELEIPPPAYHLGIGGGHHGEMMGRMLAGIEEVLLSEQPDWVLVYGDTNSTLAGALAASKLHIPVAHVEAGLRSFNRRMPEEINRVLTDYASDVLFAPTVTAVAHLAREGISGDKVHLVGDVMYDAALYFAKKAERDSVILSNLNLSPAGFVLATIHRQENTDNLDRLRSIFDGLGAIDFPVVLPLHPRTRKRLEECKIAIAPTIRLIDPVGYLDMVQLERCAAVIATDSGGVQKEAFFYGVPCFTLRDETEWVELVDLGWNKLVPPGDAGRIMGAVRGAIGRLGAEGQPYGDGQATQKIASILGA
jgi:UDP-GlcNAc3NAcA epimerase